MGETIQLRSVFVVVVYQQPDIVASSCVNAVIVNFPLEEDPSVSLIAWTTTPWTLPSNLALCVHPEFTYVKVKGQQYCTGWDH